MSNDPTPGLTPSIADDNAFRESVLELLRLAVSLLDAKFAIARLDGDKEIANDFGAPLDQEAALAEAVRAGDSPVVAQVPPSASGVRFYAAVQVVDFEGRLRGTVGVIDDRAQALSPAGRRALTAIGRSIAGLLVLRDLARSRKAEALQFQAMVEEAAVAMYSIRDGRFAYVNNKFAEMLDYTKEEILALRSFTDILPGGYRSLGHEMVRRRVLGESRELRYLTKVRRRDGTVRDIEVHGSFADGAGDRLVIGTALDVTERVSTAEILRQREEQFRLLTDNIADIILIVEANGTLTYVSAAIEKVLGYTVEERLGRSAFETIHPDDRERALSVLQVLSNDGPIDRAQFRFRHKNGSWRLLELRGTNRLRHPQIQGLIINAADVTDRRRLEQELEQLNRFSSLGRLAAQICHEFNNVMMGIQPAVDVLKRLQSENPQISRLTDLISSSVGRGKRITSDILRFGRPAQLSLRAVNVADLFNQAAAEIEPLLPPGISLALEVAHSAPFIRGDSQQLVQVLINLGLNAKDAIGGRDGALTIGARPGGEHTAQSVADIPNSEEFVHINVTDTGDGIRSEDLPYIFEPLFTTKHTGTGLGLSVVYQVVTGHGGHIFVETRRGHGTTFHIFIPRELDRRAGIHDEREESRGSLQKIRVLLVEDDPTVATGLRWVLEAEGISVHCVARAADVFAAVEDFDPAVMVLDITLQEGDGRAVFDQWAGKLPIIFSTGSAGIGELLESGYGGAPVLTKPYTADELLSAIYEILPTGGVQ